RELRDGELK
ncbi:hypothetical protein LDH09_12780, partial [Mycobacterium tuberculosis]